VEAIGHKSFFVMSQLKVPIITTIIGERRLRWRARDRGRRSRLMLQYATYSGGLTEGCASIL